MLPWGQQHRQPTRTGDGDGNVRGLGLFTWRLQWNIGHASPVSYPEHLELVVGRARWNEKLMAQGWRGWRIRGNVGRLYVRVHLTFTDSPREHR